MKMKMRISGSILLVILLAGCAVQPESISVESDCVVDVGSTAPIDWTVFPEDAGDQTLTFVSSDEAVATVDESGAVTGISPGSATVTASAANGVTAKVSVIVVLAVEKVSAEGSLTLEIGQTGRVNARIDPAAATDTVLTYASNDVRIATADETGLVTALSAGKTTVSVTAHNGRKATISVTVEIPVSGVTLGQSELMMHIGESQTLVADVTPADAAHRALIWKSSDNDVAAVDETGCVTALKEGKAAITATAGNGVSASCRITVTRQNTGRPAPSIPAPGGNPAGGSPSGGQAPSPAPQAPASPAPQAPAAPAPQAPATPAPLTDAQIEQAIGEATGYAAGLGFNIVGERQPGHSIASVAYYDYGAFLQNLKDNVDYVASLLAGEDLSLAKLCFVREGTSVYVTYG